MSGSDKFKEYLATKKFDTEHALNMYARSFLCLPASSIYDDETLAENADLIGKCHIYMIGLVPIIDFVGVSQERNTISLTFRVGEKEYIATNELPAGAVLQKHAEGGWVVVTAEGKNVWPDMDHVMRSVPGMSKELKFKILYIGQAYGDGGSRNAIDRLKKHETLQKISLKGTPSGFKLALILLEIEPANRVITMFNPWAQEQDESGGRIDMGLDKLFDTTEEERTSLFEASMIRYFKPEFNVVFKNSFPSTNMKTLENCYDKDIATVVAEISIDELPFLLFSDAVEPKFYHIASHDLHKDEDRRVFFSEKMS